MDNEECGFSAPKHLGVYPIVWNGEIDGHEQGEHDEDGETGEEEQCIEENVELEDEDEEEEVRFHFSCGCILHCQCSALF